MGRVELEMEKTYAGKKDMNTEELEYIRVKDIKRWI